MNPVLGLFEMGGNQILLLFLLVLILFGAKRIPDLARSLGLAKKEFQKAAREVEDEVEKVKNDAPPPKTLNSDNSKHAG